jgi:hypothetical protein
LNYKLGEETGKSKKLERRNLFYEGIARNIKPSRGIIPFI